MTQPESVRACPRRTYVYQVPPHAGDPPCRGIEQAARTTPSKGD